VTIYTSDHPPPHVHVIGANGEAVFMLNCPSGPAALRETAGFTARAIRQTAAALSPHIPALCLDWSRIHGHL
jgi:hypothetical protein